MVIRPAAALLLLALATPARAETVELTLPTGPVLKAELARPNGTGRAPAVVFLHGASVREHGLEASVDGGHDPGAFASAFAARGFVALAPIRATPYEAKTGDVAIGEGLAATLAALDYLRARKDVDPARIGLVGYAEGATIALWAASSMPDLGAVVLLSPSRLSSRRMTAETLNLGEFFAGDAVTRIRAPILLMVGTKESRTALRTADELSVSLMKHYKRFRFVRNHPVKRTWFAAPRPEFMGEIAAFLDERLRRN